MRDIQTGRCRGALSGDSYFDPDGVRSMPQAGPIIPEADPFGRLKLPKVKSRQVSRRHSVEDASLPHPGFRDLAGRRL